MTKERFSGKLFPVLQRNEPICTYCKHCKRLDKHRSHCYDIDCENNPNLGAVGKNYARCGGFEHK